MAVGWEVAPDDVIQMARELVDQYHPDLKHANIGILFREKASSSNGRRVLGNASTVTSRWKPLLEEEFHFIIWLAADWWLDEATPAQQRALLDHELQHCYMADPVTPALRGHDLEEFGCIIERHGFWRKDWGEVQVQQALQQSIPFPWPEGSVSAIDLSDASKSEVAEAFRRAGILAE